MSSGSVRLPRTADSSHSACAKEASLDVVRGAELVRVTGAGRERVRSVTAKIATSHYMCPSRMTAAATSSGRADRA